MLIYKITHKDSGQVYVGQTQGLLSKRVQDHFQEAFAGSSTKFHNALRKYGKEAFTVEVVEDGISDLQTLNEREVYWISYFNSYNEGYNSTIGGDNSPMHSPTTRANFLATIRSDEYRKRKSEIMKKVVAERGGFSEEHRRNLSKAMMGNKHFAGHHLSPEHIEALNRSHYKRVRGEDENGNVYDFESVQSAVLWWMDHGAPKWKSWKTVGPEKLKRSADRQIVIHGILWKYI